MRCIRGAIGGEMSQIPQVTGMHDGAAMIRHTQALREAFAQLILHPTADTQLRQTTQEALQALHLRCVEAFGWRDAEVIRAEAFALAVETTVPVGEATESDFGDLFGDSEGGAL
jgi:hypothetical protein